MISLYVIGPSFLHKMPAFIKLILLGITSVIVLPVNSLLEIIIFVCVVLCLYIFCGYKIFRRIVFIRPLIPLLGLILIFHIWVGTVNDGMISVLRLLGMVLLANIITMTTKMQDLINAITPVLRPLELFGLSVRDLSLSIALSIRFVSVLFVVWNSMNESFRSKSGKNSGWGLLPPFFIQVLKLSEVIGESLTARGGISDANEPKVGRDVL
jgi:biotin transport system permease protein